MVNYKVLSPRLDTSKVNSYTTKIPADKIISMVNELPMSPGSYGHSNDTWTIKNETAYRKTSGRIHAFPLSGERFTDYGMEHGLPTHWEDAGPMFRSWKSVGEDSQARDYVKVPKITANSGMNESLRERKLNLHERDTPVNLYVHDSYARSWPNNKIGEGYSRIHNLNQHVKDYLRARGTQEFFADLKSQGFEPEDVEFSGVGFLGDDRAIMGVTRLNNGKIMLTAARNAYDKIVAEARHAGLKPEEFLMQVLDEEFGHIWMRSYDRINKGSDVITEEVATKSVLRNHYIKRAGETSGHESRTYRKKAGLLDHDIDTIERYLEADHPHHAGLEARMQDGETDTNTENASANYKAQNTGGKVAYMARRNARSENNNKRESTNETYGGKVVDISEYKAALRGKYAKSRNSDSEKPEGESADVKTRTAETRPESSEQPDAQSESGEAAAA